MFGNLRNFIRCSVVTSARRRSTLFLTRNFSANPAPGSSSLKVTVVGAIGNVGQPLSLMLKQSPLIDELCVHDASNTCGFAMELAHIDTKCKVSSYSGCENLHLALKDSKVVVVVATAPRTTFLSHSAMFEPNSAIIEDIALNFAKHCPKALLAIATNPVNSIVPLASEVIKKNGCYNPNTIFGVTSLDVIRTNTFVAEVQGLEPECVVVPVVGGNDELTIVPLLSQAKPCAEFTNDELETITKKVQSAHMDIVRIKGSESASLSAAFAIARFVISLVKGLLGHPNIVECAYVRSDVNQHAKYLATPVLLGPGGIMRNLGLPEMTEYENCQLENAISLLAKEIKVGEQSVGTEDPPPCDPCDPDPKAAPCPPDPCQKKPQATATC